MYWWNATASVSGDWVQIGTDIDGEAAGDASGFTISLSADGTTLAVGAPSNDGPGSNAGHAQVHSLRSARDAAVGFGVDCHAQYFKAYLHNARTRRGFSTTKPAKQCLEGVSQLRTH